MLDIFLAMLKAMKQYSELSSKRRSPSLAFIPLVLSIQQVMNFRIKDISNSSRSSKRCISNYEKAIKIGWLVVLPGVKQAQ